MLEKIVSLFIYINGYIYSRGGSARTQRQYAADLTQLEMGLIEIQ